MGGNTVVLKPASLTPRTGLLFTELLAASGLPPGVINCVTGSGGTVGAALVGDARIKAISFTGSTPVGKSIQLAAARNLTPTQLELGGKNPAIVLPDADLDLAVAEIVKGAFACSGQWCTSTSRVIVLEETAAELTERLVAAARAHRRARRRDGRLRHGPRLRREAEGRHPRLHRQRPRRGCPLADGRRRRSAGEDYDHGCFIAPTVFDRVTPSMTIAREEIFGPVLVIMTVRSFEEAVEVANGVAYGLSSSIFTNDLKRALTYMERAEVGLAHVNLMSALKEPQLPFGGVKESGAGLARGGLVGHRVLHAPQSLLREVPLGWPLTRLPNRWPRAALRSRSPARRSTTSESSSVAPRRRPRLAPMPRRLLSTWLASCFT